MVDSANILQLAPYPKADGSTCGFVYSKLKNHDVSVNAGRRWGTKLSLVREPTNLRDPLCVTGLDVTIFLPTSRVHTYLYCVYGRSLYSRNNAIRAL